jgi:two-component system chemotaxis sensor kinase CheA
MKDELLAQFLIEAPDLVQQGSDALLALERSPGERTFMDDAFRAVHTLKGSVGLFDLPAMAAVLHAAEDVMGAVRSGVRAADGPTIDALLGVLTQTERWLAAIESVGELPDDAIDVGRRLAEQLNLVATGVEAVSSTAPPDWAVKLAAGEPRSDATTAIRYIPLKGAYFSGDDPIALMQAMPGLVHMTLGLRPADDAGAYDPFACLLIIEALTSASVTEVRAVLRLVPDQVEVVALPAASPEAPVVVSDTDGAGAVRTLRVDAARVESLAAVVDELVTARTALAALSSQALAGADSVAVARGLAAQSETLDRLTGRIHRQVTALRMTPVAPLLRRFPRVARELARSLGKEIDVVVEDNGVEADKTIIEGLFEPLTHLVRNAIDHGVETPSAREAAGKPRKGMIKLTARADRGVFELALQDDGAGVDPDVIRAAVRDKGLMAPEALDVLTDADAINLIFLPGFSTARALTEVSGRGVGMDAVKTAVQRLGGRIRIDSAPGQGTAVSLSLPLNLSLTKVMVVASDDETWGIPMDRVLETVRLPAAAIVPVRAGEAFNWRDRTVPLMSLASLVGGSAVTPLGDCKVLVVRSGGETIGIAVDAIQDRADMAVRPLDGLLSGMPGVSGATLLGDGRVLMILDPEALVG